MYKKIILGIIIISVFFLFYTFHEKNSDEIADTDPINDFDEKNPRGIVEGESKEYILIENDGSTIKVPISNIPEFEEYLSEFTETERQVEIDRIVTSVLDLSEDSLYIDLRYSCGTKLCNHILVKIQDGRIETKLLSEGSILKDYKISPSRENAIFIFQRNEGVKVYRNSVKIVKLKDLTEIENKEIQSNQLDQYIWPFESYGWLDDKNIFLEIPNTEYMEYGELEEWLDQETGKSKTINIKLL